MSSAPQHLTPDGPEACVALLEDAQCLEAKEAAAALRAVAQHLRTPHPDVTRAALDLCAVHPAVAIPHIPDIISAAPADGSAALHAFSDALAADRSLLVTVAAAAADLPLSPQDAMRARSTLVFALSAVDDSDVPAVTRAVLRAAAPPTPASTRWAAAALRAGLSRPLDPSAIRSAFILFSEAASARPGLAPAVLEALPSGTPPHVTWLDFQAASLAPSASLVDLVAAVHAFPSHAVHAASIAAPYLAETLCQARAVVARVARAAEARQAMSIANVVRRICSELPPPDTAALAHTLAQGTRGVPSRVEYYALSALIPFLRTTFLSSTRGARLPPDILVRRIVYEEGKAQEGESRYGASSSGASLNASRDSTEDEAWSSMFIGVRKGLLFGNRRDQSYALHTAEAIVARASPRTAADMVSLLDDALPRQLTASNAVFFLRILTLAAVREDSSLTPADAETLYRSRVAAVLPENVISFVPLQENEDVCSSKRAVIAKEVCRIDVGQLYMHSPDAASTVVVAACALYNRATSGEARGEDRTLASVLQRRLSVQVLVPEPCLALYKSVDDHKSKSAKPPKQRTRNSRAMSNSRESGDSSCLQRVSEQNGLMQDDDGPLRSKRKQTLRESSKRPRIDAERQAALDDGSDSSSYSSSGDSACHLRADPDYLSDTDALEADPENEQAASSGLAEEGGAVPSIQEMPIADVVVAVQAIATGLASLVGILNFATRDVDQDFWLTDSGASSASVNAFNSMLDRVTEMSRMHFAFMEGMRALDERRRDVLQVEEELLNGRTLDKHIKNLRDVLKSVEDGLFSTRARGPDDSFGSTTNLDDFGLAGRNRFPLLSWCAVVSALLVIPGDREFWKSNSSRERDSEVIAVEVMLLDRLLKLLHVSDANDCRHGSGPSSYRSGRVEAKCTEHQDDSETDATASCASEPEMPEMGSGQCSTRGSLQPERIAQSATFDDEYRKELEDYETGLQEVADDFAKYLRREPPRHKRQKGGQGVAASRGPADFSQDATDPGRQCAPWKPVGLLDFAQWDCTLSSRMLLSPKFVACVLDRAAMYSWVAAKLRRQNVSRRKTAWQLQDCVAAASFALRAVSHVLRCRIDGDLLAAERKEHAISDEVGIAMPRESLLDNIRTVESSLRWSLAAVNSGLAEPIIGSTLASMLSWIAEVSIDTTLSAMALDLLLVCSEIGCVEEGLAREVMLEDLRRIHEYDGDTLWPGRDYRALLRNPIPTWIRCRSDYGLTCPGKLAPMRRVPRVFVSNGCRAAAPWLTDRYRVEALVSGMPLADAVLEGRIWLASLSRLIGKQPSNDADVRKPNKEMDSIDMHRGQLRTNVSPTGNGGRKPNASEPLFEAVSVEAIFDFLLDLAVSSLSCHEVKKGMSPRRASSKSRSPLFSTRDALMLLLDVVRVWKRYRLAHVVMSGLTRNARGPKYLDELDRHGCTKLIQGLVVTKNLIASISSWYGNPVVVVGDVSHDVITVLLEIGALGIALSRDSLSLADSVKSETQAACIELEVSNPRPRGVGRRKRVGDIRKSPRLSKRATGKALEAARRRIPRLVLHAGKLTATAKVLCHDLRMKPRSVEAVIRGFEARPGSLPEMGAGIRRWRRSLHRRERGVILNASEAQEGLGEDGEDVGSDASSDEDDSPSLCSRVESHCIVDESPEPPGKNSVGDEFWASVENDMVGDGCPRSPGNEVLVETETILVSFKKHRRA